MISGYACAVPAIMSARGIENRKERLLTILVTPLMSCSARLPVYTMLIALVVPNHRVLGFFNEQGLVMMGSVFDGHSCGPAGFLYCQTLYSFHGEKFFHPGTSRYIVRHVGKT